jgi:parallel beta-helix repeat protein
MLLIGTVLPVSGTSLIDNTTTCNVSGNTLYVGGSGEGNYSSIQDAIDDSADGDTVYVYDDSSPYYESLAINKEITLLGEDREKTIIDGLKEFNTIVNISADSVTISGFTIQNCNDTEYGGRGIDIKEGDYISINNNILSTSDKPYGNSDGIWDHYRPLGNKYINITNNLFINNDWAIYFIHSPFATIQNNIFYNNSAGIKCSGSTKIQNNLIDGCKYIGISVDGESNIISKNTISNQKTTGLRVVAGIMLSGSNNQVINNNLINNERNAICFDTLPWENKCVGNYWDNWIGFKYSQLDFLPYWGRYLFWFIIDWHPASEPYDI